MSDIIKPGIMLFLITAVAAFLLGGVYEVTKEPIRQAEINAKNSAMQEILPEATSFQNAKQDFVPEENALVQEVLVGENNAGEVVGFIVNAVPKGYGGKMSLLVSINTDGTVAGISIVKSNETPGLGANASHPKFSGQYIGKSGPFSVTKSTALQASDIQAITSATITSKAVTEGVNAALDFYRDNFVDLQKGGK